VKLVSEINALKHYLSGDCVCSCVSGYTVDGNRQHISRPGFTSWYCGREDLFSERIASC